MSDAVRKLAAMLKGPEPARPWGVPGSLLATTATNPVGTSSIYPPQVATNASPEFSPLADPGQFTNEQRLGAFWNLATRRAKPYTNRDLPQLAAAGNEAVDAAMNWAGMTTPVKGIKAYHGSPHTFDKFSLDKIGTGEGAQAYGHGLYFAGNEKVAKGYKDALGKVVGILDEYPKTAAEREVIDLIKSGQRDLGAIPSMDDVTAWLRSTDNPELFDALDELAKRAKGGSMYEVNLRTSPERLLDWDKPLSQQPGAVREAVMSDPAIARSLDGQSRILGPQIADKISGQGAYAAATGWRRGVDLSPPVDAARAAADRLRASGIDGIQYLDQGSRAAGDGTRNYVMFRDDIIDILKRYGLLGMIGGGAAATAGEGNQ